MDCGASLVEEDGFCVSAPAPASAPAGDGDDDDDDDSQDTTTEAPADLDGPEIVSLNTNVTSISQGGIVRITAVVTDPQGPMDLIGGELRSTGGASYGPFEALEQGTFRFDLSWEELDLVETIEFSGVGEREVVARFYDVAGHETDGLVSIELTCPTKAACAGVCVDLDSDIDHCGSCGDACPNDPLLGATCHDAACVVSSSCTNTSPTCDDACADDGLGACVDSPSPDDIGGGYWYGDAFSCQYLGTSSPLLGCGLAPPFVYIRCFCEL